MSQKKNVIGNRDINTLHNTPHISASINNESRNNLTTTQVQHGSGTHDTAQIKLGVKEI
jgi:hypothetical protein